jgi:hypothetical protein
MLRQDSTPPAIFSCTRRLGLSPVAGCRLHILQRSKHSNQARLAAPLRLASSVNFQTLKLSQVRDRRYRDPIRSSISDPNFQPQHSVEKPTSPDQTLQLSVPAPLLLTEIAIDDFDLGRRSCSLPRTS